MKHTKAFTLIELLVVVTMIGILASIAITIINPQQKKKEAQDSVNLSTLKNLTEGIDAYRVAEGEYPALGSFDNPVANTTDNPAITTYLREWPGTEYEYVVSADQSAYAVYFSKEARTGEYYKYYSGWGKIQTCTDVSDIDTCNP